jgi:hypothetical protein
MPRHSPRHRTCAFCLGTALLSFSSGLRADWKADVGYTALQQELGAALPNGSGLGISQVETQLANGEYSPVAGSSGQSVPGAAEFAGRTFLIKSTTTGISGHALDVGRQCYGLDFGGRSGFATGLATLDVYKATDWLGTGFLNNSGLAAPKTETRVLQNHSWIQPHDPSRVSSFNSALQRLDFAARVSNFLCVAGVNNGDSTEIPPLLATAYNVVSVGLSTGGHSHGFTRAEYDGGGRIKPEIVAPLDFTSFSTAAVSGAAAMLRQAAATPNAQKAETLKAVLLAGATKEEFPNWARTATRPLDLIFGAGELHVANSYHILAGGEQAADSGIPLPREGWDYHSLAATGASADYLLEVPPGFIARELSAMLCWNRIVIDDSRPFFTPVAQVPNMSLRVHRLPDAPGTLLDSSDSPVDNLEHVWLRGLGEGAYRLRVTSDTAASYSLAWRMELVPADAMVRIQPAAAPGGMRLDFSLLVPGRTYTVLASPDLAVWNVAHAFVAPAPSHQWTPAEPAGPRVYYRLSWTLP